MIYFMSLYLYMESLYLLQLLSEIEYWISKKCVKHSNIRNVAKVGKKPNKPSHVTCYL